MYQGRSRTVAEGNEIDDVGLCSISFSLQFDCLFQPRDRKRGSTYNVGPPVILLCLSSPPSSPPHIFPSLCYQRHSLGASATAIDRGRHHRLRIRAVFFLASVFVLSLVMFCFQAMHLRNEISDESLNISESPTDRILPRTAQSGCKNSETRRVPKESAQAARNGEGAGGDMLPIIELPKKKKNLRYGAASY
jgi:hypothetical protein